MDAARLKLRSIIQKGRLLITVEQGQWRSCGSGGFAPTGAAAAAPAEGLGRPQRLLEMEQPESVAAAAALWHPPHVQQQEFQAQEEEEQELPATPSHLRETLQESSQQHDTDRGQRESSEGPSDDGLPSGAAAALRAIDTANAAAAAAAERAAAERAAAERAAGGGRLAFDSPGSRGSLANSGGRGRRHLRRQGEDETAEATTAAAGGTPSRPKLRRSDEGSNSSSNSSSKSREELLEASIGAGSSGGNSTPEKKSGALSAAAAAGEAAASRTPSVTASSLPVSPSPADQQQQQQQQQLMLMMQEGSKKRPRRAGGSRGRTCWRGRDDNGVPEEGDPLDAAAPPPSPFDSQQQQQQQQQHKQGEMAVPQSGRKRRAVGYVFIVEGGPAEEGVAAAVASTAKKEESEAAAAAASVAAASVAAASAAGESGGRFSARLRQRPEPRGVALGGGGVSPSCEGGYPGGGSLMSGSPGGLSQLVYTCDDAAYAAVTPSQAGLGGGGSGVPAGGGPCASVSRRSGVTTSGVAQDAAVRQRFLVSQRRIRGVERYLQLCEQLYFGFWGGRTGGGSSNSSSGGSGSVGSRVVGDIEVIRGGGGAQMAALGAPPEGDALGDGGNESQVGAVIHRLIVCNNTQRERGATAAAGGGGGSGYRSSSKDQQQQESNQQQQRRGRGPCIRLTPIELLTSPLRHRNVLDLWGPKEVALFEAGICKYGKDFNMLQRLIETKTTKEVVDFYYLWKQTNRYASWKAHRNLSRTMLHSVFG
ncbi:spidroin-1-like [Cyclospora cayetanensis]|uniref:Spidroin-1-like n=1 Tax=Cyclospora cayetanensis TaxID=88456 RepID=A0A6P6RXS7_9EIME|nr:spidroin-1-like [Cyclospora cayetanensis]